MKRSSGLTGITWLVALLLGTPVMAQTFPIEPNTGTANAETGGQDLSDVGRTAQTGEGEVGQRQEPRNMAPNIRPLGRIDNRIENRIQNRLRNRIDRNYDATANATAPFERAEDETRKVERRSRPR